MPLKWLLKIENILMKRSYITQTYDFPHDDQKTIEINKNMIKLTSNPDMRENVRKMIKVEMVKPMKHIVETK